MTHLLWEGCANVRDLGGHPTEDGGETRFRTVVRADSIRQLTPAGWAELETYGVRCVVDLRAQSELAADPPSEVALDVLHVPVLPEPAHDDWPAIWAAADGRSGAEWTRCVYLDFLDRYAPRFADAVSAVSCATAPVVVHCAAGKDRTGLVTALLLRLAGVSREWVAADYALSEANLRERAARWAAAAPDDAERARRLRISSTPAAAMLGVLDELERRSGSARDYLLAGGAAAADLDRARARLRG